MDENKKKLWKQAIKWPIYSVAILPVFITGAYILNQYEKVKIYNLIAFTLAAIFILPVSYTHLTLPTSSRV